jgi:hypothetical protein
MKKMPENPPAPKCEWPSELIGLLLTIAEGWRVPVAVIRLPENSSYSSPSPSPNVLRRQLEIQCPHFSDCFKATVCTQSKRWRDCKCLYSANCPNNQTIIAAPFLLPGNSHCAILCGCLSTEFQSLDGQEESGLNGREPLRMPVLNAQPPNCPETLAVKLHSLRQQIGGIARTFANHESLVESVDLSQRGMASILESSGSLLDSPNSDETFLRALGALGNIRAIGHLEVNCDRQGNGLLRHRWFALCGSEPLRRISKSGEKTIADLKLEGVLSDRWDLSCRGYRCDSNLLSELDASDPLKRYSKAFYKYLDSCQYVMIGRLGRNVARNTCDVNAQCEFRQECRLFAKEPKNGKATPWRRRMLAVDLVFLDSALPDDKARTSLLQMASQFRCLRAETETLEGTALRALPRLRGRDQRHLLRYLFEQYRAMEDSQQKGAAFERFALGLFSLVPGWLPSDRGLRTSENELDLTFLVEPAVPAAKYWFNIFGPKIIVECKNYPNGLETKSGAANQVMKLRRIMKQARVRLGLLVNTGTIAETLRVEAVEQSTPDSLIVPLDGSNLNELIDNPQDIEYTLKEWVSNAAIGVNPLRARSSGRKPPG